jgi:hypothetical protein
MRLTWTIAKRVLAWIFPVFLFDGCLNRDPYLKVDKRFSIMAICSGCPMHLLYRDSSIHWSRETVEELSDEERTKAFEAYLKKQSWHLDDITDYKLSDVAIIGGSPKGYFIADRHSGVLRLFPTINERDQVLRVDYRLDSLASFAPPSAITWMKSNWLWPWVHLYYATCFVFVPLACHPRRGQL